MNMHETILLVDDDEDIRTIIKDRLEKLGYHVMTAGNGQEALKSIDSHEPDIVILDLQMPIMDGMEVIKRLKDNPQLPIIVLTAFGTIENAVAAMKAGAFDFVTKPFSPDHLDIVIKKALDYRALRRNNLYLQGEIDASFPGIIGESQKIREALEMAQKVAGTSSTVLLLGGSGTGKEMFARFIHRRSERSKKPFVVVNSVALRDELFESELFGHEKGAFTGAYAMKRGKLEIADGGTVFFDEIGDLKPELQAKLLRVLQEREFERVGGYRPIRIDIRTIAATNQNLYKRVQEGKFRDDLFFRLNVVSIQLPLLKERKEDIPNLISFFLNDACREIKRPVMKISPEAMEHLINYHWPGNVRELKNIIERAVVLADDSSKEITPLDLPFPTYNLKMEDPHTIKPYHESVVRCQREVILRAMQQTGGNQAKAANLLNLQRTYLARLIRKLNIRDYVKEDN
ncbi:MAG: sigma-54-dependent Fis family transcriptional regulator [Nitrospirae bacterium]|nr:sigma-54-dependent Fis family transcriptional regulator [Nitrospirota bacterium]